MVQTGIKCPRCKVTRPDWCSYFCPACGAHNDVLYRREHYSPETGQRLDRMGIVAEYRMAGQRYVFRRCWWPERGEEGAA